MWPLLCVGGVLGPPSVQGPFHRLGCCRWRMKVEEEVSKCAMSALLVCMRAYATSHTCGGQGRGGGGPVGTRAPRRLLTSRAWRTLRSCRSGSKAAGARALRELSCDQARPWNSA